MTAVESTTGAALPVASTSWICQQFRLDGLTVICSTDLHCALSIGSDGSATASIGGIVVTGVVDVQDGGLVYRGTARADAPWGTPLGSCEDRLSLALTGRLSCEPAGDRLTLTSGSTMLHFVRSP